MTASRGNWVFGKADYATWGPYLGQVYSRFKKTSRVLPGPKEVFSRGAKKVSAQRSPKAHGLRGTCCDRPGAPDTLVANLTKLSHSDLGESGLIRNP